MHMYGNLYIGGIFHYRTNTVEFYDL